MLLIPGFCNQMSAVGRLNLLFLCFFCRFVTWVTWCMPWHVGHCTIKARSGFSLDVSPKNKWPNLILPLSQVACQGEKSVLGLPLPLDLTGNVGVSHGRIKWCSRRGLGQKVTRCTGSSSLSKATRIVLSPVLQLFTHRSWPWGARASSTAPGEPGSALPGTGLFQCPLDETSSPAGRDFPWMLLAPIPEPSCS